MVKKIILGLSAAVFLLIVAYLCYQIYLLSSSMAALDDVPEQYSYGPVDADLTVVEFVKYSCPHCRTIHPAIIDAITKDGNVRYVPRILPTSGIRDAQMAYAAGRQDMFKLAHGTLIKDPRLMQEGGLDAIAEMMALDIPKLEEDMQSDDVREQINDNIRLFHAIGATRTPTFIIGGTIFYVPTERIPTTEDFLKMFEEARAQ